MSGKIEVDFGDLKKVLDDLIEKSDKQLTFGKLKVNDKFIALPTPKDDKGDGAYHLFIKIDANNAVRVFHSGQPYQMPETMQVVKID